MLIADRLPGGLTGLLVGDALGVPYEFHPAADIPPLDQIEFEPPEGFRRSHGGVPPGTWSDDGAQALCLLTSLLHQEALNLRDFAGRLVNWAEHGYLAVDGRVFDIGIQTRLAVSDLIGGADPQTSGGTDEFSQGNGSLMRVLPLALWHQGSDADLVRDAERQSLPTHGHPVVQVCCALYCLWARQLIGGALDGWADAVEALQTVYIGRPDRLDTLSDILAASDRTPKGSGYVVDSLLSARLALTAGGYEHVVKAAIALGDDTDTTACIAGGLAGIRDGMRAIPQRWRDALRGREILDPVLERLLAART